MVTKKTNKHGDTNFEIVETEVPIEATASFGDERIVMKGTLALEKMMDSYKWGNQIQIVLFGKEDVIREARANNKGFNRIEIALPLDVGEKLFSEFSKILEKGVIE